MTDLSVTWRKSAIGYSKDQKATIEALGLRRLHHTVEHADSRSIRGMVYKVRHLVNVNGVAADSPAGDAILTSPLAPEAAATEA